MSARKLVGKSLSFAGSELVYESAEGFEIQRTDFYRISELRVFYDDVMFVTIHREMGVPYVIVTGLGSLFFAALALFFLFIDPNTWPASVLFGTMGSPFILAFLVRVIFQVDVITIFGRRSRARMRFTFRKERARQVYGRVCAAVRQAQRRREPGPEAGPEPLTSP